MKIKNASGYSGYKLESKKIHQNSYRKKLDSLVPGNVLLPENSSQNSGQVFKLRSIKPPIKNLRMPMKIQHAIHHLPYLNNNNQQQQNNFVNTETLTAIPKPRQNNKKLHSISEHGKKNGQLLDHMIDILRSKQSTKPEDVLPIRINTQPDNFNQFMYFEATTAKNYRGPVLDPKISKFYEKNGSRRQIFSEQKSRKAPYRELHMERHSLSKSKNLDNLQLMTFYNNKNQVKGKPIPTSDQSQNQFM